MGKSIPSPQNLQQLARVITSNRNSSSRPRRPSQFRPVNKARPILSPDSTGTKHDLEPRKQNPRVMEMAESSERERRMPLAEVVSDCVKRWFQDTLKEAKAGDTGMQVLVGQMYYSGYGVARDAQKGRVWISRASRSRSSAWKVGDKRPGYNASDSDSDDTKEEAK